TRPACAPHAVTGDAPLLGEETATAGGVPRALEIVQREEIAREVTRLPRVELGPGDSLLPHAGRHRRRIVPEGGGKGVKRPRALGASEVRTDLASDPVDRVALDAAL